MKLFREKMILLSPIIILLVTVIFSLTTVPSVNPTPKNLPILIVNEDQGIEVPIKGKMNMGGTIIENIKKVAEENPEEDPAVKWTEVSNETIARQGLDNREYYAALIIPKDFSQKQASFQTPNPVSPEVHILINQGANTMAATMAGQVLNQMVDQINNNVRTQILEGFEQQGGTLTTKQASSLVSPITKKIVNINEIGTHSANGNAPISLVQPLWMASLIGSVIVFIGFRKLQLASKKETLLARFVQVLVGAVLAIIAGYGLVWIADGWTGLNIPEINQTALFVALCYFSFYLMISAIMSWIGFGGIGLFGLLFFFGTPLLAMAPEFMSSFYRDWVYTWLPMRFASEGLRELLFFGNGFSLNHPTTIILWIGSVSMTLLLASVLKPKKRSLQENVGISVPNRTR